MDQQIKEKKTNGVTAQPIPTVGVGNKEVGVRADVEASEQLPTVSQELQGYVQASEPEVPHQPEVGIKPSLESTPVSSVGSSKISLPMTDEESEQVLKQSRSSFHLEEHVGDQAGIYTEDAKPFLAMLIRKIFQSIKTITKR